MAEPSIHHLTVRRTARYCTLGGSGDVRSVWYVLHGYRQLAERFIARFSDIATPSRLIVAPEALNRFYLDDGDGTRVHGAESQVGATWMTRHDRATEIADYVAYLDTLDRSLKLPRGTRRIVLGFSQGSQTAARWAVLGRRRVHRLVMWGGVLPPDLPVQERAYRLRALRPAFLRGAQDPSLSADDLAGQKERLAALDVDAVVVTHPGGHTVAPHALAELARSIDPD